MRLVNANEQWHGTFNQFLKPFEWKTARDEHGTSVSFDVTNIKNNFTSFLTIFNSYFGSELSIDFNVYEKINDWIKWVVSVDGITKDDYTYALHFDSFQEFELDESLVFSLLDAVLVNPFDKFYLIGSRQITSFNPRMDSLFQLADISRGFKIPNNFKSLYYFTCREWFYNKIQPVFVKFAHELELMGDSFEKDIAILSEIYSKVGIHFSDLSPMGVMFKPRIGEKPDDITSRGRPWKIIEKNYKFSLEETELTQKIGSNGEIDLIVYANMNLYLLELKARNLESRNTSNYYRNDAPLQCSRYAAWVRSEQFDSFIASKGLDESKINSVRILICSSGVFKELRVACKKTGEEFAIVPEYLLFSVMGGVFSLSIKKPFPSRIEQSFSGIKISDKNTNNITMINNDYNIGVKLSEQLTLLIETLYYDRRNIYDINEVINKKKYAPTLNMFGTTIIAVEAYIGNTVNWILDEPYLITKEAGYSFYVGTQIASVGETTVCTNCNSVIKYYLGESESQNYKNVGKILMKNSCNICNTDFVDSGEVFDMKIRMTHIMAKFKGDINRFYH